MLNQKKYVDAAAETIYICYIHGERIKIKLKYLYIDYIFVLLFHVAIFIPVPLVNIQIHTHTCIQLQCCQWKRRNIRASMLH